MHLNNKNTLLRNPLCISTIMFGYLNKELERSLSKIVRPYFLQRKIHLKGL